LAKIEKLDSKDISSISSEIMSKFIIGLSDKGLHNTTRNHYLGTLRTFFNHLVDDKFLNNNPCKGIKK
jgi:site-specific recombinase XerC